MFNSQENVLTALTKVINLLSFVPTGLRDNLQFILAEIYRLFKPDRLEVTLLGQGKLEVYNFQRHQVVPSSGQILACGQRPETCSVLQQALPILKFTCAEPEACAGGSNLQEKVYACLPVVGGKDVLGMLTLGLPHGSELTRFDLEVLLVLTNLVGITVQRDRLLNRIEGEKERLVEANRRMGEMASGLIQAEKLAATGRIAADLAHEINNPMGIISARAECLLLEQAANLAPEAEADLEVIIQQARRVGEISRLLLNVFRLPKSEQPNVPVDVRSVLREVVTLVRTTLHKQGIALCWDEAVEPVWVWGKENHLQQVLFNLILNAIDAMPSGGTLTLQVWERRERVTILVEDSGAGIAPADRDRIFEPFYTTKGNGQGTGLGLSISQKLVQEQGGELKLLESNRSGTCFAVELESYTNARG